MIRFVTVVMMLAVSMASLAGTAVKWLRTDHDFGAFDEELGIVRCTFRAVNTGTEPVVVLDARANCGCTTPVYGADPVAPGDTLEITVGYNATGRPGKFHKKVVVTTTAVPARVTLGIAGTVIGTSNTLRGRYPVDGGAMKLRDNRLAFGNVDKVSVSSRYIEGVNAAHDTIRPLVTGLPGYITASVRPLEVPPGETFIISALFDGARCPSWDVVTDSCFVVSGTDTVAVRTAAIIKERFEPAARRKAAIAVSPSSLDAGRIDLAAATPLTWDMTLSNYGDAPLLIRQIASADPAVTLTVNKPGPIKPGKSARVRVSVDPARLAGRKMLNSSIIIIANDPARDRTVVRLTGEILPQP